jgi:hypothetical protein
LQPADPKHCRAVVRRSAAGVSRSRSKRSKRTDWSSFTCPPYAPEINPQEGVRSLLKRAQADFAAADLAHLTRAIKRKLKRIQYRPHLIVCCLPTTGLDLEADRPAITDSI